MLSDEGGEAPDGQSTEPAPEQSVFVPGVDDIWWQGNASIKMGGPMHGLWDMQHMDQQEEDQQKMDIDHVQEREVESIPITHSPLDPTNPLIVLQPLVSHYKELFGIRPEEHQLRWVAFLSELLGRFPTKEEIGDRYGLEDEDVTRLVYGLTGQVPDVEDWQHADQVFVATGQVASMSDFDPEKDPWYLQSRPRLHPAVSKQYGTDFQSFKARVKRDANNPSIGMIERSKELQEVWDQSRKEEFEANFKEGTLIEITSTEAKGMINVMPVWVFATKRNGSKKTRLTMDGSKEDQSQFQPNSTYAPTLPVEVLMYLLAYGTYHRMRIRGLDWKRAFLRHNDLEHPAHVNHRDIAVYFSPWQSGGPKGMWAKVGKLTQGFVDAPMLFGKISDELLIDEVEMERSQALGMSQLFVHRKGESVMALGKNVDDLLYVTTDSEEGEAMAKSLLDTCKAKGWEYTSQELGKGDEPFVMHSFTITPTWMQGDKGILVTQPAQLDAIQAAFFGSTVDLLKLPETMLPPHWSPTASAADPNRVDAIKYMQLMGTVAWAGHTLGHSGAISLLQSQGGKQGGPSSMDLEALHWLAGYMLRIGREGAGRMFFQGPIGASTDIPPPLHGYADSGLPGHVNGAAQDGRAVYMGTPAELNGAFLIKSNKNTGRQSDSVPGDEARAAVAGSKDCIAFSEIGMELAGRQPRRDHGDLDYPAPALRAGTKLGTIWEEADGEEDVFMDRIRQWLASGYSPPSVAMHEDSQAVVNAVHANNQFKGVSKLRHEALSFQCLADWHRRELIRLTKCSATEQKADALTGVPGGPIATTRAAIDLFGWQPALQERLRRQFQRYPRADVGEPVRVCPDEENLVDMEMEDYPADDADDADDTSYVAAMAVSPVETTTWPEIFPSVNLEEIGPMLTILKVHPGRSLGRYGDGRIMALDGVALAAQGRKGMGLGRHLYEVQGPMAIAPTQDQVNLPEGMQPWFVPVTAEVGHSVASVAETAAWVAAASTEGASRTVRSVSRRVVEQDQDIILAKRTHWSTNHSRYSGKGPVHVGMHLVSFRTECRVAQQHCVRQLKRILQHRFWIG